MPIPNGSSMADLLIEALRDYKGNKPWEEVISDSSRGWALKEVRAYAEPGRRRAIFLLVDGSVVAWATEVNQWLKADWVAFK